MGCAPLRRNRKQSDSNLNKKTIVINKEEWQVDKPLGPQIIVNQRPMFTGTSKPSIKVLQPESGRTLYSQGTYTTIANRLTSEGHPLRAMTPMSFRTTQGISVPAQSTVMPQGEEYFIGRSGNIAAQSPPPSQIPQGFQRNFQKNPPQSPKMVHQSGLRNIQMTNSVTQSNATPSFQGDSHKTTFGSTFKMPFDSFRPELVGESPKIPSKFQPIPVKIQSNLHQQVEFQQKVEQFKIPLEFQQLFINDQSFHATNLRSYNFNHH